MGNSIQELSAKIDTLQAALDAEQVQIASAIQELKDANAALKDLVAQGGTEAERQALSDKIGAVITDLQSTIPDQEPTGRPEIPGNPNLDNVPLQDRSLRKGPDSPKQ